MSTSGDARPLQTANTRRSAARKRDFLREFKRTGSVIRSAVAVGISDRAVRAWREKDSRFAKAFDEAQEYRRTKLVETSERELARRAILGRREPIYQNGALVGYRRRPSDRLLLRQLEAEAPEKWGRRTTVNHTGNVSLVSVALQARLADPAVLEDACSRDASVASGEAPRGIPGPEGEVIDVEAVPAADPAPEVTSQDNLS